MNKAAAYHRVSMSDQAALDSADDSPFIAEDNSFGLLGLVHDHIRKYPGHAVGGFHQSVSLVASSIRHAQRSATAMPPSLHRDSASSRVFRCRNECRAGRAGTFLTRTSPTVFLQRDSFRSE